MLGCNLQHRLTSHMNAGSACHAPPHAASWRPGPRDRPFDLHTPRSTRACSRPRLLRPPPAVARSPRQSNDSDIGEEQAAELTAEGSGEGEEEAEEGEDEEPLQELSQARHVITEEGFLPEARLLRDVFDSRFADPRSIRPERFMWDYWHVPEQYTLVRTQAQVHSPRPLPSSCTASLPRCTVIMYYCTVTVLSAYFPYRCTSRPSCMSGWRTASSHMGSHTWAVARSHPSGCREWRAVWQHAWKGGRQPPFTDIPQPSFINSNRPPPFC